MNKLSWLNPEKPIRPGMARSAALLNLFATPGLGSMLAGRWLAGFGQLMLACAGFVLVIVWFVRLLTRYYALMYSNAPQEQSNKLGGWGAIFFAIAWVWSLVTSLQLLLESRHHTLKTKPGPVPVEKGQEPR